MVTGMTLGMVMFVIIALMNTIIMRIASVFVVTVFVYMSIHDRRDFCVRHRVCHRDHRSGHRKSDATQSNPEMAHGKPGNGSATTSKQLRRGLIAHGQST